MPTLAKRSAGLLMFRQTTGELEVLLAHPGGPFWRHRDGGAWTIPKGGVHDGEDPLDAAIREFREETGFEACAPFLPLGEVTQRSGKIVAAWAFEGTCEPAELVSARITVEWPPRSGKRIEVPEVDEVRFFRLAPARLAVNPAQVTFLDRLEQRLDASGRR